jgi:hypothetical protein
MPARPAAFEAALEGLTRVNERLLTDPGLGGPALPKLYESGVVYKNEPRDVWRHAEDVNREGWGDCEDLSAWRAAELRVSGEDPDASVGVYKSGPSRYHAVVKRGDGTVEDPSRALGMGAKPMRRAPRHAVLIGEDPTPGERGITFEVMKIPGKGWGGAAGWRGIVRIPIGVMALPAGAPSSVAPGVPTPTAIVTAGPVSSSPSGAIQKAAGALLNNQAVMNQVTDNLKKMGPYGQAAAMVLSNPVAKKVLGAGVQQGAQAIASGIKKLKFW